MPRSQPGAAGRRAAERDRRLHIGQQHLARQRALARAADAGDGHQPRQRHAQVHALQVVQAGAVQLECRAVGGHRPARPGGVAQGRGQAAAGDRLGRVDQGLHRALGDQPAAQAAGAGADVDDMVGAADGVLVMLDDDQGVALGAQARQGVQQDAVVARMQADGGLVEHVAHALQPAAELGGQADALGLAAAQGGGGAVQRQVAQAHVLQEAQAAFDLGHHVAGDGGLAAVEPELLDPAPRLGHRQRGQLGDAALAEAHGQGHRVQARAVAAAAGGVGQVLDLGLGEAALAAAVLVGDAVVQGLALLTAQGQAGADAVGAPAVLAVVGEEPRVGLGEAAAALRAGALGGEDLELADARRGPAAGQRGLQAVQRRQHVHHALAMVQGLGQQLAQPAFLGRVDHQVAHRQLQGVLLESVQPRPGRGGQEVAIHPQVAVAALGGPLGQVGVEALAVDHQGREQADVLAAVLAHQLGGDGLGRLRRDGDARRRLATLGPGLGLGLGGAVRAVLHAQLDVHQPQEVPDLGGGGHRALAATAREALLDGHRGRNAPDRVHLRPTGRLHDAAGVGVEGFEVAALALVEQDVEGQGALARAADAGDDVEAAARDVHAQALQVVLAGVDDLDGAVLVARERAGTRGAGHGLQGQAFVLVGRRPRGGVGAARLGGLKPGRRVVRRLGDRRGQAEGLLIRPQRCAGVRGGVARHLGRRPLGHQQAAALAAFGAEVEQPVGAADHVEVVLDDDQRMPGLQQAPEGAHELGDVVEVQAGGGLVEEEERALLGQLLAAGRRGLGGLGQEAGELQALGLAAAEGGHGLAELDVVQPHLGDGRERAHDLAVLGEEAQRVGDGELQHVGDAERAAAALDGDLAQLGAEARALAVAAAQVDVAEELHLHMLEARAAAARAAAVAGVEAEHARAVAALLGQRGGGEERAHRVEGADVAGRVGARGLADGALVDEDGVRQPVGAEQALVRARGLAGLAEVARQGGEEHVLDQGALARAADPGDHDQALQRELGRDGAQVVLAHALQDEARSAVGHRPAQAQADAAARAEVGTGQGLGGLEVGRRAVEDDAPALAARAGAEVDHPVGGQHHGRVVLDHDQGVAGVAQALHGAHDAVHVARVQADAGLVQHEERVDQGGAERGGQVDALHLAAAEGAALAVQAEVAQAHVAEVLQALAHLVEQQGQGFVEQAAGQAEGVEEAAQPIEGQQHQVVQAQARQGFELGPRPGHAPRQEALSGRQQGLAARGPETPQQRFGLEPRAAAGRAAGVAAVLGQEHADVHLVGLALQVLEEALQAVPLLAPDALVGRVAVDDPGLLGRAHLRPGGVARDAGLAGQAHQVVLALGPGGRLQRLDGAAAQGLAAVGHDQAPVHADDAAEAAAGLAGAGRAVEGEQRRAGRGIAQAAVGAVQAAAEAPEFGGGRVAIGVERQGVHMQAAAAAAEAVLQGLDDAGALHRRLAVLAEHAEAVGHHVELLHRGAALGGGRRLALGLHPGVAAGGEPLLDLLGTDAGRQLDGEADDQALARPGAGQQFGVDALRIVLAHGLGGLAVEQPGGAREQQLQVVVQLGHRADRAAAGAHRVGLVDGDGRRHAVDAVDRRAVHAVEELPRVGAESLDVAALALGIQRVEDQAGLARAAGPGDHGQLAGAQVQVEVLEVVLPRTADADPTLGHGRPVREGTREFRKLRQAPGPQGQGVAAARAGRRAQIARCSAGLACGRAAISSRLRRQPAHRPRAGSMRQTWRQGLGGA